jgi:hypothetical protein
MPIGIGAVVLLIVLAAVAGGAVFVLLATRLMETQYSELFFAPDAIAIAKAPREKPLISSPIPVVSRK